MKPALAAARTVDLLNFLTVNPQRVFTLTELSDVLDVSPASLSAILRALTEAGFLLRHPRHKTFEIGPALVATGHAASLRHPVLERARPHMHRLAALGRECVGSVRVGDEIMILQLDGPPSSGIALRIGQRLPLVPPYGLAFLSWSDRGEVDAWTGKLREPRADLSNARLVDAMTAVRARGFAVGLATEEVPQVQRLIDDLMRRPRDESLRRAVQEAIPRQSANYLLGAIDPDATYAVDNISAPVFGADERVAMVLTVQGFGPLIGAEVATIGEEIASTCGMLTRGIDGHAPRTSVSANA